MELIPSDSKQAGLQMTKSHRGLSDKHFALEREMDKRQTLECVTILAKALRDFEEFSRSDRDRSLQGGLTQTDGDRAVCAWITERYENMARIAREIVPAGLTETTAGRHLRAPAWALAILLAGHASKWRKISGQRPDSATPGRLHQLFRSARDAKIEGTVQNVTIERRFIETTVEALYVRALLLERFASGNLTPRRLEILDTWLVAWMGALWLTTEPADGGATLCVDTQNPTRGLTRPAAGEAADFYLALRPLRRQLERAVEYFHQGIIFPGWGIAMSFRMEEHIAVIDFVERELNMIEHATALKSKRFPIAQKSRVSVFFGFSEIFDRALFKQSTVTTSAGLNSASSNSASVSGSRTGAYFAPAALRFAALAEADGGLTNEFVRSPVQLLDISEAGMGLEMSSDDAAKVEVDELVAVRVDDGRPWVLGIVVRKVNQRNDFSTTVGIKVLTKVPMRAALELVTDRPVRQAANGIFVAGSAAHGFADSIIVSDATYRARPVVAVTIASGHFHIRLGRVRYQGPGWKMAAANVLEAR
jgi:hypothetical protein